MAPLFTPELIVLGLGPILFGLALIQALRILSSREDNNSLHFLLWLIARTSIGLGMCVSVLGGLGPLLGPLAFVVIVLCWRDVRNARRRIFIQWLAAAIERGTPLEPAMRAFAEQQPGWPARKVRLAATLLSQGKSLADALDGVPRLLSPEACMQIRLGEELGMLAPALRTAMGPPRWEETVWRQLMGKLWYLAAVVFLFSWILLFIEFKILPAYQKILSDFEMPLPGPTRALAEQGQFLLLGGPATLLSILAMALWLYLLGRLLGVFRWNLPGIDRLLRGWHAAGILDALAMTTRGQRPLPPVLDYLAARYPRMWVRGRLRGVCRDVQAGLPWCDSLQRRGLVTAGEAAVLQAAERVGNLPWALSEMASGSRRRLVYRLQALLQIAFPCVVGVLGLVVMWVGLALFLPLIHLVNWVQ